MVAEGLPSFQARIAARAFGFKLRPEQEQSSALWGTIFHSQAWMARITSAASDSSINPVLIGRDLGTCCVGSSNEQKLPPYMVLVIGDKSGDTRFDREGQQLFLDCLQPHTFSSEMKEVTFDSGGILNVTDVFCACESIAIRPGPQRLFSYPAHGLCTACMFWQDGGRAFRTIECQDVVGIGGQASTEEDVSLICGIVLTLQNGTREQYVFERPNIDSIPIRPMGKTTGGWRSLTQG